MGFNRASLLKAIDATAGPLLCRCFGAWQYETGPRSPPEQIRCADLRRILIIRPGGMGDMIVLYPVIRALQEACRSAEIDVACETRNAQVLTLAGMGDRIKVYDRSPLTFLSGLRRRRYDVAIDTEQFHHFSAVFACASGAPVRIGFNINPRRNPLYTHLVSYDPAGREGDQFMRLLAPLGLQDPAYELEGALARLPPAAVPPDDGDLARVMDRGDFAVVHAGASTPYKLWQEAGYAELLAFLHGRRGIGAVLVGDAGDAAVSRRIVATLKTSGVPAVSCAGRCGFPVTAGIMKRARLFVGADSGLAHLAVAMAVPSVVLFGPTDHVKWGIENARHAVVRYPLACSPCFIFGYHKPCRHVACMRKITAATVQDACEKVLGMHPRP